MEELLAQAQCLTTILDQDESQSQASRLLQSLFWYLIHYAQDADGNTKLHVCMANLPASNSSVERLIDATWPASLLNIANYDGMTALHLGAIRNEPARVRQLLVAGAHPMIKNNGGFIPLHYACENGNIAMIDTLTRAFDSQEIEKMKSKKLIIPDLSKSINMRNNEGVLPLHLAIEHGHLDVIKLLLKLGADFDPMQHKNGDRSFHIAIKKGYKHIASFILDYYRKNPSKMLRYYYYQPELMKPLKQMGLDDMFIKTFKIPIEKMYPQSSSDSE